MVRQIYPTELRLNKTDSFDTEAPFLDLDLSITNGIVSSKNYDKRDFNVEIVNFPFRKNMFIAPLPMVYMYIACSLFVLREFVLILVSFHANISRLSLVCCFVLLAAL